MGNGLDAPRGQLGLDITAQEPLCALGVPEGRIQVG